MQKYVAENKKLMESSRTNQKDEARLQFKGESNKLFRQAVEQLGGQVKINDDGTERSRTDADSTFNEARNWILGLLIAIMVIAMVLAVWVARIISVRLNKAVEPDRTTGQLTGRDRFRDGRAHLYREGERDNACQANQLAVSASEVA